MIGYSNRLVLGLKSLRALSFQCWPKTIYLCKLFGVIKTNDIKFVQYFSNYLEFDHLVNFHRFTFLCKLYNSGLISYTCAYDKPDLTDLHRIMSLYNLNTNDSKNMVKNKIWKVVTANIDNLM